MANPVMESVTFGAFVNLLGLRWYYYVWPILLVAALIMRFTEGGRKFAKKIGDFNARLILTLIYVIVLWPFGFLVRLLSDPLRIKKSPSKWLEHPDEVMDMNWAKRQ
jgi:hypothetical protein